MMTSGCPFWPCISRGARRNTPDNQIPHRATAEMIRRILLCAPTDCHKPGFIYWSLAIRKLAQIAALVRLTPEASAIVHLPDWGGQLPKPQILNEFTNLYKVILKLSW